MGQLTLSVQQGDSEELVRAGMVRDVGAGLLVATRLSVRHTPDEGDPRESCIADGTAWFDEVENRYVFAEMNLSYVRGEYALPISANSLRGVPVAAMLAFLRNHAVIGRTYDGETVHPVVGGELPRLLPRTLDDEAYMTVLQVHRLFSITGNRALVQTAEQFGVSRSTVHNWISEARRRGLDAPVWGVDG